MYLNKGFISILLLVFSFATITFGQDCENYKWKKCGGFGPPYKYSGQSKGAFFTKGQSSDFYVVTYKDFEYSVRICHDKPLNGLFFRIREDNVNRKILYDSSAEEVDYLEKQFSTEKTQKLIIEVVVPEGDEDLSMVDLKDISGCVGVLIEYYRKPKTGF